MEVQHEVVAAMVLGARVTVKRFPNFFEALGLQSLIRFIWYIDLGSWCVRNCWYFWLFLMGVDFVLMIFCQQRQRQEMAGIQPGAIHPSTLWIWWTYTQWCWLVFHGYLTNSSWNSKNYVRLLKPTCDQLENTQQVAAPRPLQCQQNQWWTRTLQYLGHFWWKCAKVSIDPGLSPAKNHRMMFAGWCRHFLHDPFTRVYIIIWGWVKTHYYWGSLGTRVLIHNQGTNTLPAWVEHPVPDINSMNVSWKVKLKS